MKLPPALRFTLLLGVLPVLLMAACEAKPGSNDGSVAETGDGDGDGDGDETEGEDGQEEDTGEDGEEDTGEEEGEEDGCNFADCPCEGDECPPPMCDIWAQDCLEGEKCTAAGLMDPNSWDSNICVPVLDDPDVIGSPCMRTGVGIDGNDTCELGAMCWNVDQDTGLGVCIGFCEGSGPDDASCPSQNQFCSPNLNDGVLPICQEQCHPLDNPCAAPNDICVYTGEGFGCALDASGDMAPAGSPCAFANSCNDGLYCTPADFIPECAGDRCCSPYCYTDEPNNCGDLFPGGECLPFFEEGQAPPGYDTLGVCSVAP